MFQKAEHGIKIEKGPPRNVLSRPVRCFIYVDAGAVNNKRCGLEIILQRTHRSRTRYLTMLLLHYSTGEEGRGRERNAFLSFLFETLSEA